MTFLEAISTTQRRLSARLVFGDKTFEGVNIKRIQTDESLITGESFEIGTAIANVVNIELVRLPTDELFEFTNAEFMYDLAVTVDGVDSWVTVGYFTVEKVSRNGNQTVISAVDRMYLFDQLYTGALTYPTTIGAILADVCTQAGVVLATPTFANSGYSLAVSPSYLDVTMRLMVSQIAELAGGFAKFNSEGELTIVTLSTASPRPIVESTYLKLTVEANAFALIDRVVVSVGDVEASAGSGTNTYTVANNMFVQSPSDVVNGIYNVLNGLSYTPIALLWMGDFSIPLGNRVTVTYKENELDSYILRRNTVYNGGLREVISSPMTSDLVKNSVVKGAFRLVIDRMVTEIAVMEGEIALRVTTETFTELEERVGTAESSIVVMQGQIALKVSTADLDLRLENYATIDVMDDSITLAVGTVQTQVDEHETVIDDVKKNFVFNADGITITQTNSAFSANYDADGITFIENSVATATLSGQMMSIREVEIEQKLRVGVHQFEKYNTTITIVTWVG